jgi:hypothetical protein
MCTISWELRPEGYDLFFTRDEQRSRAQAEPPRAFQATGGTRYLAPTDPVGGGTWIFINTYGLTGALLNAYEVDAETLKIEAPQSRGQLLRSLASADNVGTYEADLTTSLSQNTYAPCYLIALAPGSAPGFWLWNGRTLEARPVPELLFFTTSSVRSTEVRAHRTERFRDEVDHPPESPESPEALERFHRDLDSRLSAFDIRMSRPDARSVSLTHVRCRQGAQTLRYASRDGDGLFDPASEISLKPLKFGNSGISL